MQIQTHYISTRRQKVQEMVES